MITKVIVFECLGILRVWIRKSGNFLLGLLSPQHDLSCNFMAPWCPACTQK